MMLHRRNPLTLLFNSSLWSWLLLWLSGTLCYASCDELASRLTPEDLTLESTRYAVIPPLLGEGKYGCVFKVREKSSTSPPTLIIKIPKFEEVDASDPNAHDKMFINDEVLASRLTLKGLPGLITMRGKSRKVVYKPLVTGVTLDKLVAENAFFPNSELVEKFKEFLLNLVKSQLDVSDINPDNLMFNSETNRFEIIDGLYRGEFPSPQEAFRFYSTSFAGKLDDGSGEHTEEIKILMNQISIALGIEASTSCPFDETNVQTILEMLELMEESVITTLFLKEDIAEAYRRR